MIANDEKPRVLICATGAASVISLPAYLIGLRSTVPCDLTVAMSAAATQFLPPRVVAQIADRVVDGSDPNQAFESNHMHLALAADLMIVLPASANTLANAAHGLASDLVSATVLASRHPVVFLPSMNRVMWDKPALQRNVKQLREDGHKIPEPTFRRGFELADHSFGEHPGMPTPPEFLSLIEEFLKARQTQ
ncbi:flavoprotein [Streptomyces flaveolus]|uniref:flavoprotein n=1 Tax=Streptomyces flaveolus TaxID=67297 RepID=UPI0034076A89